jgi:hypothetical protein
MPSSPTKTSSEASAICHTDRLVFQPGRGRAQAQLGASGAGDQGHPADGAAVGGVGVAGGAAGVVAVEAVAPVGVELGAAGQVEGAEHQAQPGAGLAAAHAAAVAHVVLPAQGGDVGRYFVPAQGGRAAQPGRPLGAGLDVGGQGGLGDAVLADGAGARAPFGAEQADAADAVLAQAGAHAELGVAQGRAGRQLWRASPPHTRRLSACSCWSPCRPPM